jgi:septin family protein
VGPFLLGVLIAGLVAVTLVYNCYHKRELTERKLKQDISNLEHNLAVVRRESELRIEQLETELKRAGRENKKFIASIDVMQGEISSLREQLEECQQRLEE